MTYNSFESSLELGTPVELYEFVQGLLRWNYVSGATEVIRANQIYTPSPIKRTAITQTNDVFKDSLKITLPREDQFASQFLSFSPEEVTTLTILRGHANDPDREFRIYWKGRIVGARVSGNEVTLECESIYTSIRRPGLRARFEYTCRHTLYGARCAVNSAAYRHDGTVLSLSGLNVTVQGAASRPNGYYTGGMLIAPNGGTRFITAHSSDVLTLSRPIPGLTGGQVVTIYPGCDHLKDTCLNKFNNLDNFGGFPFIPQRNPFDGSSII